MAPSPITKWQIDRETMETVTDFIFLGSKITADGDCSHEIKVLAPQKKSNDKRRQCNKKQRHYFAEGPSSQSYGFSGSHVWMWELDYEESWGPKNWCFGTVVLEQTLEIPLDCASPTPRDCSNSCPSSQGCHPTISFSVIPFSSCLQYFPASGSFPRSQFFTSGGRSIGVSASTSILPMNIQHWFPLGWTSWISLQSKGLFKSLPQHHNLKASILWHSAFLIVQLSYPYTTTGKTIALTRWTFVGKVMSLLLICCLGWS